MNRRQLLQLNLATRPAQNMRLYNTLRNMLAAFLVLLIGLAVFSVSVYGLRTARLKASLKETNQQLLRDRQEESRLTAEIQNDTKANQSRVDAVNAIILRKSFSWTSFLSQLEVSLPDSSYITALLPNVTSERTIALRIRVVSRGLGDLIRLINNFYARKFRDIRVESEGRTEGGQLVSEISLTYERDI